MDNHNDRRGEAIEAGEPTSRCPECAQELIYSVADTALYCTSCRKPVRLPGEGDSPAPHRLGESAPGDPIPDGVCLFSVTAEQAEERFKAWQAAQPLAPKEAREAVRPEPFRPRYVPAWLFSARAATTYTGRYGNETSTTDGNNTTTYFTTWYDISGSHSDKFTDELVFAACPDNGEHLAAIAPYSLHKLAPCHPAYFTGYPAEKATTSVEAAWDALRPRLTEAVKTAVAAEVKKEKRADKVEIKRLDVSFDTPEYLQVLLPLWTSSFTFKDERYSVFINGQTGKVSGTYPVSGRKMAALVISVLAGLFILLFLLITLLFR